MSLLKPTIAIIGTGSVGSTIAYSAMLRRVPAVIHLVDVDAQLARGQATDLADVEFITPTRVKLSTFQQASKCDIIVIAAGERQKPGEDRMQCRDRNVSVMKRIIDDMRPINPLAVILMVTNPVLLSMKIWN